MPRKKTREEFISDAQRVHGDRYDYSMVNYVNTSTKVCIICPDHGAFWQDPCSHLQGSGCPKCFGKIKRSTDDFIRDARLIHGDRYDYSLVDYKSNKTKVCIICPTHGEFWQTPNSHLNGNGCRICAQEQQSKDKRYSTSEFISKARLVHGNLYDYSKVDYQGAHKKVCIICPTHGEFWQEPARHLAGARCPLCFGTPKKTTVEFIYQARRVHGDKYDYSKVDYKTAHEKVCIICPDHGEFWQAPVYHLQGQGCRACTGLLPYSTESFIAKARMIHKDRYDYSKTEYKDNRTKVCIICPDHGEFWQTPHEHLSGRGCHFCFGTHLKTTEEFIAEARLVHGNKYDYSKVDYRGATKKILIICPEHGEFAQTPIHHLYGQGCRECAGTVQYSTESFIAKAREIHGEKYDYSKVEYKNALTKVCIICPEHGEFWQKPNGHLQGYGCPSCSSSKLESTIRDLLSINGIEFEEQKQFDWLVDRGRLRLDFFLSELDIAIECQGCQHFESYDFFGGEEGFETNLRRDSIKRKLCHAHGIEILYFSNLGIDYPYQVFENKEDLLQAIMSTPDK